MTWIGRKYTGKKKCTFKYPTGKHYIDQQKAPEGAGKTQQKIVNGQEVKDSKGVISAKGATERSFIYYKTKMMTLSARTAPPIHTSTLISGKGNYDELNSHKGIGV